MFSRHNERVEIANNIPSSILESIKNLVLGSFQKEFIKKGYDLEVFGELYDDEIVLIFSLENTNENSSKTLSLFISQDLDKDYKIEKKIDHLVSSSSEFFEIITTKSEEEIVDLYSPRWQESDLKKENFHYKISRENIKLTIEANKLLQGK